VQRKLPAIGCFSTTVYNWIESRRLLAALTRQGTLIPAEKSWVPENWSLDRQSTEILPEPARCMALLEGGVSFFDTPQRPIDALRRQGRMTSWRLRGPRPKHSHDPSYTRASG